MSAEISTSTTTDSHSDPLTPPLEALYWTQYGTWYPIFRRHAPKSTVIDLDSVQPELIDWMDSETFVLPDGSGPSTTVADNTSSSNSSSSSSSSSSSCSEGDADYQEQQPVRLPNLDAAIRSVISKYDSAVFPKLNWSAPLDSSFMLAGNNLQCRHPEDIYLVLKSSEFVGRDLEQISAVASSIASTSASNGSTTDCQTKGMVIRPQLVLKKWFALNRSYEFRCFVRSRQLVAICQRDVTFYEHLQSSALQSRIRSVICDFFDSVVKREQRWALKDAVMDVYVAKGLDRVWLVDVNPWLPRTDPLLWDYEQLEGVHRREREVRLAAMEKASSQAVVQADQVEDRVSLHLDRPDHTATHGKPHPHVHATPCAWGQADIQLRILSDRRLQAGRAAATYSSNMVPQDLVELAKSSSANAADMSVDQLVERWNDQVDRDG